MGFPILKGLSGGNEVSDCEMVEDIQSSGGMKFSCFWFVI